MERVAVFDSQVQLCFAQSVYRTCHSKSVANINNMPSALIFSCSKDSSGDRYIRTLVFNEVALEQ